jgi:hypothetical protein
MVFAGRKNAEERNSPIEYLKGTSLIGEDRA